MCLSLSVLGVHGHFVCTCMPVSLPTVLSRQEDQEVNCVCERECVCACLCACESEIVLETSAPLLKAQNHLFIFLPNQHCRFITSPPFPSVQWMGKLFLFYFYTVLVLILNACRVAPTDEHNTRHVAALKWRSLLITG